MLKKKNIKFILLSLLILYIFIFSDIGVISRIKLDKKIKEYEQKIIQIKKQNDILKIKIEKLKNDYDYIIEQARKLGYARPGEKKYRFIPLKKETNQKIITNKKNSLQIQFNLKDYLIYIITFIIVVSIYIILVVRAR